MTPSAKGALLGVAGALLGLLFAFAAAGMSLLWTSRLP